MSDTKYMIMNNTGAYLDDMIYNAIKSAIANGGILPEELSDMFTLYKVGNTWILDWFEE